MKMVNVDYAQFKSLVGSKALLGQFKELSDRYELFAVESVISWETVILKDGGVDHVDFETHYKAIFNAPLEYRTIDGLAKVASSRFIESLSFFVDGEGLVYSLSNNTEVYLKKHYAVPVSICGADIRWSNAELGDHIYLEVGIYMTPGDETSFYTIGQYGNHFNILGSGNRVFDVPAVKTLPSQVPFPDGNMYDTYIRAHIIHGNGSGTNNLDVALNFLMWRP